MEGMEPCLQRISSREKSSRAHALDIVMASKKRARLTLELADLATTFCLFLVWSSLIFRQKLT